MTKQDYYELKYYDIKPNEYSNDLIKFCMKWRSIFNEDVNVFFEVVSEASQFIRTHTFDEFKTFIEYKREGLV